MFSRGGDVGLLCQISLLSGAPAGGQLGSAYASAAGSARAAIRRPASASWNSTTAPAWATCRSSPTATLPNYESEVKRLTAGCSVTVEGELRASGGQGQATELHADQVVVHGWADPETYPLQKKRHSFEKLREWAHLRPRTNTFGAVARVRNQVASRSTTSSRKRASCTSTRRSSRPATAKGPARCSASPRSTWTTCRRRTAGSTSPAISSTGPAYLTVSGQLEAEIFATALGKVYTFGPTFRAENSNTSRHLAEFWMVEPEMAFFDLSDNMDLAERFLKRIFRDVLERCPEDMAVLQRADRPDHDRHAAEDRRQRLRPTAVHRSGRDPGAERREVRVSRSPGAAICRPSTSAT